MRYKIGQKVVFIGVGFCDPTANLPPKDSIVTIKSYSICGRGYYIENYERSFDSMRQNFMDDVLRPLEDKSATSDLIEQFKKSQIVKETEVELIPEPA